jgi:BirA family biotin operon repressor/biotin-[acetyl-CoA-carboxylase] ligase
MREKIVEFLKKNPNYVSGEELSRHLRISRQGLWKHIQELRVAGYDILAVPHLGYRLISCPDRLLPLEVAAHLNTKFIGKKIYYFETLSSTMDEAVKLGLAGVSEGTVVLAETQTRGRGRLGRRWFSPKHKGIYFSLILRPKILPNATPILTLLCAVGVCEAIKENLGLEAQIKWPNDIFMHHKKLGGILTELNAEMDVVRFVVVGIGINANTEKKNLISGATSLKEQKKEQINRLALLQEILRRIEKNYLYFCAHDSGDIINKWREYSLTLGKRIRVVCQKAHLEGEAVDIEADGGLLVRKDSGLVEKIMAGDVVHCR